MNDLPGSVPEIDKELDECRVALNSPSSSVSKEVTRERIDRLLDRRYVFTERTNDEVSVEPR